LSCAFALYSLFLKICIPASLRLRQIFWRFRVQSGHYCHAEHTLVTKYNYHLDILTSVCSNVGQLRRNTFGRGSGQIWLDDVVCSGSESSVGECRHSGWGVHDCSHWEDVAISCVQLPPSPLPPNNSTTYHLYFVTCDLAAVVMHTRVVARSLI